MVNYSIFIFVSLFLFHQKGLAQDRYAIHFKYKPTELYRLDEPENLLGKRALERRSKEGMAVDSTDIPVSEKYISSTASLVNDFLYHSKWLNASIVVAEEKNLLAIADLDFVDKVVLVAKGGLKSSQSSKKENLSRINKKIKKIFWEDQSFEFQNNILGIPDMHQEGYNGEGVRIAVFDAGFLNVDEISGMQHLFEEKKIIATRDFVNSASEDVFKRDTHGTGSLSLLAAYDPEKLIAGAYESEYVLCITEDVDSENRIEEYNWVRAAEFSDSLGVDIINSSLGYNFFDDPEMNYTKEDLDGETAVISIGAAMAAKKGILVVSSTGNEGNIDWQTITVPADAKGILSVGAINNNFEKAAFSSVGPSSDGRIKPELVAFGSGVTLWRYSNGTSFSSGTSFSAPQIAALAAGLWQAHPEWTRSQLKERLIASGSQFDEPDSELGYGVPNYLRAMYGTVDDLERKLVIPTPKVYPNPLDHQQLFIEFGNASNCLFKLFNTTGNLVTYLSLARNDIQAPYEVELPLVHPGVYLIELEDDSGASTIKLLRK
ncbi:MAG: S8 family peptidase [Cyclobacteriaceae bacterium]